ncbi:hypothetical protein L3Q82_018311 [Scortum barcoo]|uniref:Uncharacterized protein n=1 Tax=Scortum barcoo TaxID=214431 RepID=A0ACB8VJ94_9TELE|nr:hypothetical protein L3Q82_018311 [Scortum barcoo]
MMTFSAGCWICLLTLTVAMLFSAGEVVSSDPIGLPCCHKVNARKIHKFQACYEQFPRDDCKQHAFLIINKRGQWCISPNATWLNDMRDKLQFIKPHLSGRKQLRSRVSSGAAKCSKMWTTFSAGRWICLLTLAGVMPLCAAEVNSQIIELPCCRGNKVREIDNIKECFEQNPRARCNHHAYVIITKDQKMICVAHPPPPWLKKKLDSGELSCPPEISKPRRLKKKKKM